LSCTVFDDIVEYANASTDRHSCPRAGGMERSGTRSIRGYEQRAGLHGRRVAGGGECRP
jgi:hypothetical protein